MKKDICECSGCHKTGTIKIRNGHRICEDHAKTLRQIKKAGKKPRYLFKEKLVGHVGEFDLCVDIPIKL